MPEGRPAIPAQLERDVLIEAGYRCAMPTCRETVLDICHIEPWAKVQKHEFANLIALCVIDHRRFDRGDIDRLAMRQIKANLSLLRNRYTELERRILDHFARHGEIHVGVEASMWLLYQALVDDGIVVQVSPAATAVTLSIGGSPVRMPSGPVLLRLTSKGLDLVQAIQRGEALD